jgi:hypothetical protein
MSDSQIKDLKLDNTLASPQPPLTVPKHAANYLREFGLNLNAVRVLNPNNSKLYDSEVACVSSSKKNDIWFHQLEWRLYLPNLYEGTNIYTAPEVGMHEATHLIEQHDIENQVIKEFLGGKRLLEPIENDPDLSMLKKRLRKYVACNLKLKQLHEFEANILPILRQPGLVWQRAEALSGYMGSTFGNNSDDIHSSEAHTAYASIALSRLLDAEHAIRAKYLSENKQPFFDNLP